MLPKPCDVHHGCQVLRVSPWNFWSQLRKKAFHWIGWTAWHGKRGATTCTSCRLAVLRIVLPTRKFHLPSTHDTVEYRGFIPFWVYCKFCWMFFLFFWCRHENGPQTCKTDCRPPIASVLKYEFTPQKHILYCRFSVLILMVGKTAHIVSIYIDLFWVYHYRY